MKHLFCFGLGYSATALARSLSSKGWKITGTARNKEACEKINKEGCSGVVFDGESPIDPSLLGDVTHILLSIPPGSNGDPVYLTHKPTLAECATNIEWAGYLSTTGVYGDRQGGRVDETSPLSPSTKRGEKRVLAEQQWLNMWQDHQLPVHLFRLAGIYGPGSNQLEKVRDGSARRRIKPGQVFSRIHLDDIVGILEASIATPHPGRAYNVCDDEAVPPQDVVEYAADLLGVEPPPEMPFDPDQMTPMGLSFFSESKHVSNERIKRELGYELKYPTYREGLKALLPTVGQTA